MKKLYLGAFSAATALVLLAGATGAAWMTPIASAASPQVTTLPATGITSSDATLNGMNGDADATGHSFWVSTSTFSTASTTLPAGVYSTPDLGAVASSTSFSALLSSAAGLPAVTPGTTYFFAAWTNVGGTWSPGDVLSFTTLPSAPAVTGISPSTGTTTGGTPVTITGTGLTGATAVDFGATSATGVVVNSDTSVTAVSPATTTAGVADVTVTTPGGTSATSSADQFTYSAPAATSTEPVISNVAAVATGTSTATITWNTDIAANSQVVYGTTTSYGASTALDNTATTTHSVNLTGLQEATLYHFEVESANGSSTTAVSSDQEFTTQSTASTTPLAVTGVDTINGSATADNSFSDGWHWVMHLTVPDNENAFRIKFSDWAMSSTTSFPANGNIEVYSPESSNASTTGSAIVSSGNGFDPNGWLYLNGDTSTATPGRQIDLDIVVKIPVGTPAGSYTTTYTAQSYPESATSTAI